MKNRRIVLKKRAAALPGPEHFELLEDEAPDPADGQVLVRNQFVSVDPAMKGWISVAKNYASVEIGETMRAFGVGDVIKSRIEGIETGDLICGATGWQDFGLADPSQPFFRKVDRSDGPISTALGIFGISGLTAWHGLLKIGKPKAGETVVVSTAAGAVGSAVGQIARIHGCRTVGIAGGPKKVALCRDAFRYDEAIDYRNSPDLTAELAAACPHGIDIYYDNVGGQILDTVMSRINTGARIVICGTAATASWDPPPLGNRLERSILVARATMSGFIILDHSDEFPEALSELRQWVSEGRIKWREDVIEGLDNAPSALASLYQGANNGRMVIKVITK